MKKTRLLVSTLFAACMLYAAFVPAAAHAQKKNELGSWHYPYGFLVPDNLAPAGREKPKEAELLVWVPPEAKRIRAVVIIAQNTDSMAFGANPRLKEVATRHEMGIVYARYNLVGNLKSETRKHVVAELLNHIAEGTGIAEFRHAPWIPYGKSSVGAFPCLLAWAFPERTIATLSYHAEPLKWPAPDPVMAGGETLLNVSVNGELEWGGVWNRVARPSLMNYRAHTSWLPHQVVSWRIEHGNYPEEATGRGNSLQRVTRGEVWDYLALFVDKAMTLRVPEGVYPTDGPVKLKPVDPDKGYLVHPFAIETLLGLPRFPLLADDKGTCIVDPMTGAAKTPGFMTIPPAKDYQPRSGTPVVAFERKLLPREWVTTGGLRMGLAADPMENPEPFAALRPAEGDILEIDGNRIKLQKLDVAHLGSQAIGLGRLRKLGNTTLMLYTVVRVEAATTVRVDVPFTANGRVQMLLNGVPVTHKQVIELQPGLYPMMIVAWLRTKWDRLKAVLVPAKAKEIAWAKTLAAREQESKQAAAAASVPGTPVTLDDLPLLAPAADVDAARRRRMLWIADEELARAWFKLHAVNGTEFTARPKTAERRDTQGKKEIQVKVVALARDEGGGKTAAKTYEEPEITSAPVSREASIKAAREAIEAELAAHGGSWEAWAKDLKPYRDDIRDFIEDYKNYKWPWPAKHNFVYQGAAVSMHGIEDLMQRPAGEGPFHSILHLHRQLAALGIDLIVAIIPSKLSTYPDYLYAAVQGERRPVRVPEDRMVALPARQLLYSLLTNGVEVVDLYRTYADFRKEYGDDPSLFYTGDSHYRNLGARLAAVEIAKRLRRYDFVQEALKNNPWTGKKVARVDGGKTDLDLLSIRKNGQKYMDSAASPVVLAGDSHLWYNNQFGAQTSAQIARHIGMPLCLVWKEGLSANIPVRLARDPRLASRKVVILHYTERMLWPRAGKWNLVNLPGAGETKPVTPPVQQELRNVPASGVIKQASPGPDTKAAYPHYIMKFYVENLVNLTGRKIGAGDGVVHVLAMHNRKVLPAAAGLKPGAALKVMLTSWSAVEKTHGRIQSGNLDDVQLEIEKPLYWGVIEGQPVLTEEELERVGQEDDAAGGGGKTAE